MKNVDSVVLNRRAFLAKGATLAAASAVFASDPLVSSAGATVWPGSANFVVAEVTDSKGFGFFRGNLYEMLKFQIPAIAKVGQDVVKAATDLAYMILSAPFKQIQSLGKNATKSADKAHWENYPRFVLDDKNLAQVLALPQFSMCFSDCLRVDPSTGEIAAKYGDFNVGELLNAKLFAEDKLFGQEPIKPTNKRAPYTNEVDYVFKHMLTYGEIVSPATLKDILDKFQPRYIRPVDHVTNPVGIGFQDRKDPAKTLYWVFGHKPDNGKQRTDILNKMLSQIA